MNESTEMLIERLAAEKPTRPRWGLAAVTGALAVVSLAVAFACLGPRPDIMDRIYEFDYWFKILFLCAVLLSGLLMMHRASHPLPQRRGVDFGQLALWSGVACYAFYELLTEPWPDIVEGLVSEAALFCFLYMLAYGLLGQFVLARIMRLYYAPGDAKSAGAAIGICAAAVAAIGYTLHCEGEGPTFLLIAYGVPTLLLGFIGARVLPRYLAW